MSEQTDKPMTPESRRYTAEELRARHKAALDSEDFAEGSVIDAVWRQAAEDCAVLERLKAWFINLNGVDYESIVREEVRHGR